MPQLIRAEASHNQWSWFFGQGKDNPCSAARLLIRSSHYDASHTWNAGCHAPGVTLWLGFDIPVAMLMLCPNMDPAEGVVGLVVVLENTERIAHRAVWSEGEWVTIRIPTPCRNLHSEFVESPSWIALHAVDAS